MESGVYDGICEEVLAPKLQEVYGIAPEHLMLYKLYTTSDFKLFRDDKPKKGGGVSKFSTDVTFYL